MAWNFTASEFPDVQAQSGALPERGSQAFLFKNAKTVNREGYLTLPFNI